MSDYFNARQETADWSKGTLGLNVVKISLSDYIRREWVDTLMTWTTDELEHLPGFFSDVIEKNLIEFDKKQKCWKLQTTPSQPKTYQSIFSNILYNFTTKRQRSSKIVWNPYGTSKPKFQPCKLTEKHAVDFTDNCSICKKAQCKYEGVRKGYDLYIGNDDLLTLVALFQGHTETALKNVRTYYWRIACMFMFSGNERCLQESTCPADTEPSLVFKMMNYCSLFKQIDQEYEEILEVRNCLMHSPNQRLSSRDLELCMKAYNDMLTEFEDECKQCCMGRQELTELQCCLMTSTIVNGQDCDLIKEALEIQRDAITYEINVLGRMTQPKYVLQGILEAISSKSESKTWTYDADAKRRENEERTAAENRNLKESNEQFERQIRQLMEEVCSLKRLQECRSQGVGSAAMFMAANEQSHEKERINELQKQVEDLTNEVRSREYEHKLIRQTANQTYDEDDMRKENEERVTDNIRLLEKDEHLEDENRSPKKEVHRLKQMPEKSRQGRKQSYGADTERKDKIRLAHEEHEKKQKNVGIKEGHRSKNKLEKSRSERKQLQQEYQSIEGAST